MVSRQSSLVSASVLDTYLRRMAHNDTAAQAAFYEAIRVPVYAYALSFLRQSADAEDVLHDCYLQVCSSAADYQSRGKPMAWILTITRNLCLKRLHQASRMADAEEELPEQALGSRPLDPDDRVMLQAVLSSLSEEERQIVVAHTVTGLKHREIAVLLQLPLSTVLSKYRRALAKLRDALS